MHDVGSQERCVDSAVVGHRVGTMGPYDRPMTLRLYLLAVAVVFGCGACSPPDPIGRAAKEVTKKHEARNQASQACKSAAGVVRALTNDDTSDDPDPAESKEILSEGYTAATHAAEQDRDRFLTLAVAYADVVDGWEQGDAARLDQGYAAVAKECTRLFK